MTIPPKGTMARAHAEALVRCRQTGRILRRDIEPILGRILSRLARSGTEPGE